MATVTLNASLGLGGVWYIPSSLTVNAGTGTINITGTNGQATGWRSTPVSLTGAVNITGNIASGAALTINSTAAGSVAGTLSGAMVLTKSGTGTLTLTAANTFTGGLTVNAGTLIAATPNLTTGAAGGGTVTVNSGGTISVTTDNGLYGTAGSSANALTINAGGLVTTASGSGHLSALVMNGGTLNATVRLEMLYGNWDLDWGVSTLGNGSSSSITGGTLVLTEGGGTIFNIGSGDTLNVSSAVIQGHLNISTDFTRLHQKRIGHARALRREHLHRRHHRIRRQPCASLRRRSLPQRKTHCPSPPERPSTPTATPITASTLSSRGIPEHFGLATATVNSAAPRRSPAPSPHRKVWTNSGAGTLTLSA